MPGALFHVYPDLNGFLSRERASGTFHEIFQTGQTIKHLVEAAGIPHTEVGALRCGGQPVDLSYQVQDGDQLEIFPAAPGAHLPAEGARFVLDNHLGRLAASLRMLGFDALYRNDYEDTQLAQISAAQNRILLTRDRRLLMRKSVQWGYCLRSLDSRSQVREVLLRYNLLGQTVPFRRCLRCNALLEAVQKEDILDQLEPLTRQYYNNFHRCPGCGQIYWKGSHYERMRSAVARFDPGSAPEQAD